MEPAAEDVLEKVVDGGLMVASNPAECSVVVESSLSVLTCTELLAESPASSKVKSASVRLGNGEAVLGGKTVEDEEPTGETIRSETVNRLASVSNKLAVGASNVVTVLDGCVSSSGFPFAIQSGILITGPSSFVTGAADVSDEGELGLELVTEKS